MTCPNCSLYLTFHKIKNKAICHHCSFEKKLNQKCNSKDDCEFFMYGLGVEKIYEEIERKFPKKNIEIFSSDYLKKNNETKKLFKKIQNDKLIF